MNWFSQVKIIDEKGVEKTILKSANTKEDAEKLCRLEFKEWIKRQPLTQTKEKNKCRSQ
jgi:hypothetical protein